MKNTYWEYASTRYKTKIKAIEASGGDITSIAFSAFDTAFYSYTWDIEPKESFQELLVDRAKQLRDTYKYLKLWYSGGADSTTVLKTFIENGIFIDEIVVSRMAINDNFSNKSNLEIDDYTTPFLKSIQHIIPKTKINYINIDKNYYDIHLSEKWLHTKSNLDMRHLYIPRIRGKSFCNIFADCNPMVYFKDNEWFSYFYDTDNLGEYSTYSNIELFFTSENMPALHAKQLHMVKNYLKLHSLINLKTNTPSYKSITAEVTRSLPIVRTSFIKNTRTVSLFDSNKNKELLRLSNQQQRDSLRSLYSTKINGKSLINLFIGYKTKTISLGE